MVTNLIIIPHVLPSRLKALRLERHRRPIAADLDWEVQRRMWGEVKDRVESARA